MSHLFQGIILRCSEPAARALFSSLDSRIPLRLVRLDDDVFGIYARQDPKAPAELQRIASRVSRSAGAALFYWYTRESVRGTRSSSRDG